MIIKCVNCNKIFDVNSSLIPNNGRNIQCGSCNHIWFYKHINADLSLQNHDNKDVYAENEGILNGSKIDHNQDIDQDNNEIIDEHNLDKKTNLSLSRVFSFILVGIFSLIAIIVLLDTFKSPLSNIFPDLELLLYNLFETILDMFLFIKNLLV